MSYPYPAAPPPPPPGKQKLRGGTPRKLGWIFLALAVALFVVGGILAAKKSYDKVNDFQRISISGGTGSFDIDGTGKWVGYYEASNVSNSIDRIPGFTVAVADSNGKEVTIDKFGKRSDGKVDKFTYDFNGHKGAAAFQFEAAAKGTYRIQLQANESLPSGAQVAIGRDIVAGTLAAGILIVIGVLALITAIVLLIVGFVKRSRHKKELARYGGYGAPPPPNYGPPPGGGYGPPPGGGYGPPA